MSNENSNKSLLQTILTIIDALTHEGKNYDILVNVLSLLCLLSILNRLQPSPEVAPILAVPQPTTTTNPLQKILGDLTKSMDSSGGGGGPSPDMLMSLLPLLNNPQIKSKLNPANISNLLGLMNNLGGSNTNDKPEPPKPEKKEKKEPPPTAPPSTHTEQPTPTSSTNDTERKELGGSLNWKTNFQNEKEV